jgi:hypothetical protein
MASAVTTHASALADCVHQILTGRRVGACECVGKSRIGGGGAAVIGWQRQKWEAAGGRVAGATTGSLGVGCESALPAATCHCVSGRLVVRAESVKLKLRCLSDLCNFTSGHSRCQAMRRVCVHGKKAAQHMFGLLPDCHMWFTHGDRIGLYPNTQYRPDRAVEKVSRLKT